MLLSYFHVGILYIFAALGICILKLRLGGDCSLSHAITHKGYCLVGVYCLVFGAGSCALIQKVRTSISHVDKADMRCEASPTLTVFAKNTPNPQKNFDRLLCI